MITIKNIRPIQNHIIFEFVDETAGGVFTQKTKSGLIAVASMQDQKGPRWGKVLKVGPTVNEDIKEGEYILIEGGMWTTQQWLEDGTKIWKTDDTKVIATSTGV